MKKNNIAVILILAVSAVLFTSGVIRKIQHMTSGANKSGQIIAVIPKGTASMWWEVVRSGAEQAGKEEGYTISWNGPEQENDREKQIQSVEDALTHGIKALVLAPNDSKALVRPVEKAKESIPVVIIDSSIETDKYDSFAATDNIAGGADAAHRLGAALNGHGKVILTCFIQNSASTDDRAKGFRDAIAKDFPGITIIAEQYTAGTVEDARQKTVDMLTKHSDADGVFAVNQPVSVGAYKALQTQGLTGKVKFVGFDSDPVLLEGIEKGEVEALIVQNPYEIGYSGVKTAVAILQGKQVEKLKPIPSMVVDKANLDEMKVKFPAALGLTSGKAAANKAQTGKTIAVIPKGTASMWWEVVRKGAEKAGEEEGCKISWNGPEQENDREKQIQSVEDSLTRGAVALVLAPNDSKALVRPVEKAKGSGIPVVIIDSSIETDKYDSFAATDNVAGGADAAHRLGAALNGHGKVILTCFIQNSASTDDRAKGFRDAIAKEFPGITIVAEQYTAGTVEDARQKTVDMLTKHSDADGVFAVNQPVSVGAYKALQTQGLAGKVKFVGFDSDPVLLEGIEKGEVEALIVQNPYEIGYSGVKIAVDLLNGKNVDRLKPIPSMVVDKANLEQMKAEFPSALGL